MDVSDAVKRELRRLTPWAWLALVLLSLVVVLWLVQ